MATTSGPATRAGRLLRALARKKPLDGRTDTRLDRCLGLLDLTALGVGSTLGLGLYVLAGQVASTKAGPAVVVSFALAALASAFSALCYAEFAGRVPRAGSAYAYSYITVGEAVAFVIGWNLVLEYVIGASSVARGFSGYLVYVYEHLGHSLAQTSAETLPGGGHASGPPPVAAPDQRPAGAARSLAFNSSLLAEAAPAWAAPALEYLARYFDWPSVAIVLLLTGFILVGVKESTKVTMAFTLVNLVVVLTVVASSLQLVDWRNWRLAAHEVPAGFGRGGFLPYGWSGVLAGSATCFFGFIGFDTIASSAEEARNPRRNVPIAIVLSLFVSFVAYVAVALVQTLLWPYYDQNRITILPYIFARLDAPLTYWIVLLGALAGLASSQLGGMYPLPRILYSMAQDRLIYGQLAHVNRRLKLPVRATLLGSLFIALLSCLLDIQDLADMVSIGTLAAYSLVSLSVLIVRYEHRQRDEARQSPLQLADNSASCAAGAASSPTQAGQQVATAGCPPASKLAADGSQLKRPQLLDLLIVWKERQVERDDPKIGRLVQGPDARTSRQSKILISFIVFVAILLDLLVLWLVRDFATPNETTKPATDPDDGTSNYLARALLTPRLLLTSSACICLIALLAGNLMLSRLPTSEPPSEDTFQVPLVPLVPTLSILVNAFLMLNLSYLTWVRFAVWMALGLFIYITYGIRNSVGYLLHTSEQ